MLEKDNKASLVAMDARDKHGNYIYFNVLLPIKEDFEIPSDVREITILELEEKKSYKIYVGRDAFSSEEQLANTIAHELRHARDYIKKGKTAEKGAYKSGNSLAAYIRGER